MSTSEQEVQSQVAEMRQALRSAAASRRIAKLVSVFAVIVGFCIVAFFVWQILGLGSNIIKHPEDLQREVTKHVELMNLEQKATEIVEKTAPAYMEQIQTLFLKDKELHDAVSEQADALFKEAEPIIRQEAVRLRPRLEKIVQRQADRTVAQDTLQKTLSGRLASIMEDQSGELAGHAALSPEQLAVVAEKLQNGLRGAVGFVWEKRTKGLDDEMNAINELISQIPDRDPQLTPEETYKDIMLVLVAILREELPTYNTADLSFVVKAPRRTGPPPQTRVGPQGAAGPAAEAASQAAAAAAEGAKKVQENIAAAREKAIREQAAKDAAKAAEGGQR
jgi:hypothetical protein